MKTYWDHTEQERAGMSEEDVRKLLDFELMEKGVLRVAAPVIEDLVDVDLPKKTLYVVKHGSGHYGTEEKIGLFFSTLEQAQTFIDLKPMIRLHDYDTSKEYAKTMREPSIIREEAANEQDVLDNRSMLTANKERKQRNAKATQDYEVAARAMEKTLEGVWADWHACKAKASEAQKVIDTLDEYKRLTGGNTELAKTFLAKAFTPERLVAAEEWAHPAF
jgi:hypothetical protein